MSKAHQLAGRIGGFATAARNDTRATTAKARQTFHDSFEVKVDPNNELSPAERARRADAARSEHYARLSAMGAKARRNSTTATASPATPLADGALGVAESSATRTDAERPATKRRSTPAASATPSSNAETARASKARAAS